MKDFKFWSLLLSFNCLVSCGYRWQPDFPNGERPTVSVPFVKGDEDGRLTAEIIRCLSHSGIASVRSFGGQYELQVTILGSADEKIGFRIDPQKVDGKVRKNLLACEGRKILRVEASLFQGGNEVYGPYLISTDAEYDYVDGDSIQDLTFTNSAGVGLTVLPFSLGQLESLESAQQAATHPLYVKIAQKIVDAISREW